MATTKGSDGKPIEQYTHKGKDRANNPPVGLVTPETDRETVEMYLYNPHLDPTLVWPKRLITGGSLLVPITNGAQRNSHDA